MYISSYCICSVSVYDECKADPMGKWAPLHVLGFHVHHGLLGFRKGKQKNVSSF